MSDPHNTAPAGIGQVDKTERNPHDFKATEASRPDWNSASTFTWTKTKNPDWSFGDGASKDLPPSTRQIPIDPHAPGRDPAYNYRLITSAVIPRPTALLSTTSLDGTSTNLAPYSFFQAMSHDPPTFVIGHAVNASSSPSSSAKDSLKNLRETRECVINILTEEILEAGNACAVSTPYGVSEWLLSGLTPLPCTHVRPSRVSEAVFAVECRLVAEHEIQSKSQPGKIANVMTIVEGVKFWVREDVVDADGKYIDPARSKPIGRLQGISYGRVMEGFQIPWPSWEGDVVKKAEGEGRVGGKAEGQ